MTLPQLLVSLYEELLQPLPPQLEDLVSQEDEEDQPSVAPSNLGSVASDLSSTAGSECPPSDRSLRSVMLLYLC